MNEQAVEGKDIASGEMLDVIDIWSTIQGEGPFAGQRAVFIRLAGCNLTCYFCDTGYTQGRKKRHIKAILAKVKDCMQPPNLVVITGGEPFRQNLFQLINLLQKENYQIQIETNGTVAMEGDPKEILLNDIHIVCSPKTPKIDPTIQDYADAFKYILDSENIDEKDGLPTHSLGMSARPFRPEWIKDHIKLNCGMPQIYIQPMDTQDEIRNRLNLNACINSVMKFGYKLSLQTHKIIGVP